jgi:hypothetical protein
LNKVNRRDLFKFAALAGTAAALTKFPITKGAMSAPQYALGKKPARPYALKLKDYLPKSIWVPSGDFGHAPLVSDWQMLGNDTVGDCAIAEPYHALMLWNAMANRAVNVDTQCTLNAYSAITGYNPNVPNSDKGSDMVTVAQYWQNTGLTDASGTVHKIDAFVALDTGNFQELITAMYLFNGVGIGVNMPNRWMADFQAGKPWDHLDLYRIVGGHAILGCGRVNGMAQVITWGTTQLLTQAGYEQFSDEALVYLDSDMFADIAGKDIDGFNWQQLQADMQDLATETQTWSDDGGYTP